MNHLTRNDYAHALQLVERLEALAGDLEGFAHAAVAAVGEFVACELATLSVCDLVTDHRSVLYADSYPRVGLEYVAAVPLFVDGCTLVSIVLNRRGLDFSERDRERLELLRPHLSFLYRQQSLSARPAVAGAASAPSAAPCPVQADAACGLTRRESEVMHWLARGKTDADIAALLSISPRTVHKHLEHIYVKLGVETRTAAVMRALAMRVPDGRMGPDGIGFVAHATRQGGAQRRAR